MRRTGVIVGVVSLIVALVAYAAAPKRATVQVAYTGDGPCLRCHFEYAAQWQRVGRGWDTHIRSRSPLVTLGHSDYLGTVNLMKALPQTPLQDEKGKPSPPLVISKQLAGLHRQAWQRYVAPTLRAQTTFNVNAMPHELGCETCHGPGSLHVAGMREAVLRWQLRGKKPDNFRRLDRAAQDAICLPCHEQQFDRKQRQHTLEGWVTKGNWSHTPHSHLTRADQRRTPGCLDCHEVHHPERLNAPALIREAADDAQYYTKPLFNRRNLSGWDRNCTQSGCHADIIQKSSKEKGKKEHHPIVYPEDVLDMKKKGKILYARGMVIHDAHGTLEGCIACHNEHGTNHCAQIRGELARDDKGNLGELFRDEFCQTCHRGDDGAPARSVIGYRLEDHHQTKQEEFAPEKIVGKDNSKSHVKLKPQEAGCAVCHGAKSCTETCHRSYKFYERSGEVATVKRRKGSRIKDEPVAIYRHKAVRNKPEKRCECWQYIKPKANP